jgi:hypothetical protein
MPKHRSTVYTVVREKLEITEGSYGDFAGDWQLDGLVGTYASLTRADEIAAKTIQEYLDRGMDKDDPEYRCTVKPSTWYDE